MATQQMSVTMTGFAATHPSRHPSIAKLVTFRMASTPSWNDNGEWKDSGTLFIDVQCWGRLGDHVLQSVLKGAPVVAVGRMTSYSYVPDDNARKNREGDPIAETIWRVTASNVGLDLSHSTSTWSLRDRVKDNRDRHTESAPQQSDGASLGGYAAVAADAGAGGDDRQVESAQPTPSDDVELTVTGGTTPPY